MFLKNLLQNTLFPGLCVLCNLPSRRKKDLCIYCESNLPWLKTQEDNNIFALFSYEHPIDYLITKLKFNHKLLYAKILGDLMTEQLALYYKTHDLPELIIPVPLHNNRLRERGFNQALELAKPISKMLKIKIDHSSCIRTKNTIAQSSIPAKDRHKNIKNVFALSKKISAQHIAIIDDVITTGSTIQELRKILADNEVKRIDLWCLAKTCLKMDANNK